MQETEVDARHKRGLSKQVKIAFALVLVWAMLATAGVLTVLLSIDQYRNPVNEASASTNEPAAPVVEMYWPFGEPGEIRMARLGGLVLATDTADGRWMIDPDNETAFPVPDKPAHVELTPDGEGLRFGWPEDGITVDIPVPKQGVWQ